MIEVTQNYELKGRGVETWGADFLVKRDIPSWIGAGSVIQPCLSDTKVAVLHTTYIQLFLNLSIS